MSLKRWSSGLCAIATLCGLTTAPAREKIVAMMPHSAALFARVGLPVNLDRLEIGPVQATLQSEDGKRVLVVESELANLREGSVKVPMLRVSVRDGAGLPLYTWTTQPSAKAIAAKARLPFRTRLTAPPAGADVVVEFLPAV